MQRNRSHKGIVISSEREAETQQAELGLLGWWKRESRDLAPFSIMWIMSQRWNDLLFAHWPIEVDAMRALLPRPLQPSLDTYDGKAWVGVIPFWMSRVRFRFLLPLPGMSTFPELNVRTYVNLSGRPGVYFFSLDAYSWPAVLGARASFNLNYFYSRMSAASSSKIIGADNAMATPPVNPYPIHYRSRRMQDPQPAELLASYGPTDSQIFYAQPGSLESFLVDRYSLFAVRKQNVYRADIEHPPWPLQLATAKFQVNTVAESHGIYLPRISPLLHFAKKLDVKIAAPALVNII